MRKAVFLFHTGSIKSADCRVRGVNSDTRFYSILVRLKAAGSIKSGNTKSLGFLFHTGSIKSAAACFAISPTIKFLFHTGSIKSCNYGIQRHWCLLFLFHTGSIKSIIIEPVWNLMNGFLFHTGSIKRLKDSANDRLSGLSFYSILVRLKGFMKAVSILYGTLMIRVKSIFIYIVSETNLLSTGSRANSLGDRRILTKRAFPLLYSRNGTYKTDPNRSFD